MSHLVSCSILEKTDLDEFIWAWAYPSITEHQKDYILKKTPIDQVKTFFYGKTKTLWFYVSDAIKGDPQKFDNILSFSIILWAKDFNPDKYEKLGNMLGQVYGRTASPPQLLRYFISVMTIGICRIDDNDVPMEFSMVATYNKGGVKDLIKQFDLEAIIIYSAMLLKKRLIVYHHSLLDLLEALKIFPSLLPHRKFDEVLFPWFEMTDDGVAALRNRRFFVAGCYDSSVFSHPELTDVFVNMAAKEISVTSHAKDGLIMTKVQKDVALYLAQLSEGPLSDEEVINKIKGKTQEIVDNMLAMTEKRDDGRQVLYISALKEDQISSQMESFYVQLARAENILVLDSPGDNDS